MLLLILQLGLLASPGELVVLDIGLAEDQGASLPGRHVRAEKLVHLLQGAALGLGEHEEDVNHHGNTESGKNEVGAVLDVLKSWGHSVGKDKVESPVGTSRQRHSLGADAEGVDLGGVGP